jgi:hypothetical protein
MKVGQKAIVRWISKRIAKRSDSLGKASAALREVDALQLRYVAGGDGGSTQSPNRTW